MLPGIDSATRLQRLTLLLNSSTPENVAMPDTPEGTCAGANLSPEDSLHLAAAVEIGCNMLVRTDQDSITIGDQDVKYVRTVSLSEVNMAITKASAKFQW